MNLSDYPAVGTPNLAAKVVGVDVRTIRREIKEGRLDSVRAGSKTLITRFALLTWLKLPMEVDNAIF